MNLKDWVVDQHVHHVPKEIVCFNQQSIYKKIDEAEKKLKGILKSDLTHNWIIGSDLPYKYWLNINYYTPFSEMKENFKWKKK